MDESNMNVEETNFNKTLSADFSNCSDKSLNMNSNTSSSTNTKRKLADTSQASQPDSSIKQKLRSQPIDDSSVDEEIDTNKYSKAILQHTIEDDGMLKLL